MAITRRVLVVAAALLGSGVVTLAAAPAYASGFSGTADTYFDVGLGTCGIVDDPLAEQAALPAAEFSSALCGKTVTVTDTTTGRTVKATVTDECPSCSDSSLDLSVGAFAAIASPSQDLAGQAPATWHF